MSKIDIRTLHDGLNLKDDPADPHLTEGATVECLGFDLTVGGKLQTAGGNSADHDLIDLLPTGAIQCSQIIYMAGVQYVLATTIDGLYSNAILIDATFTGKFKALTFGSNIYLTNGTYSKRFDGTTCYKWGIVPPVVGPTLSVGANVVKTIDTMEVTTDWIANAVGCTVTDEVAIVKYGSHSCKIAMAATGEGSTYRDLVLDLTKLSDGSESPDDDLIRFWFYVSDLTMLSFIRLLFDLDNGDFNKNFFSYEWSFFGGAIQSIRSVIGTTTEVIPEDATAPVSQTVNISNANIEDLLQIRTFNGQNIELYQLIDLTKVESGAWVKLQVPKAYFLRTGDDDLDWSNVVTVGLEVGSVGAVNIYVDQIELAGGGKLLGIYYFMYGWARVDSDGNVIHYSGPARAADGTLHIQGPATIERQPLVYTTRTASTDPQVNACVVYIIGGNLTEWYVLDVIQDNLTTAGIITKGEEDCYRKMISLRNDPAPAGMDMVLHRNAVWMVGFNDTKNAVRRSDVSVDGDILLEAWPARNAYIPSSSSSNKLTSIDVVNRQVLVRGIDGEYALDITNPSDFGSVIQDEVVGKGCLSDYGILRMNNSVVYPAAGAFVESLGSSRNIILPEAATVITASGMKNAVSVFNNLDGYYSFIDDTGQNRTAKVDLFSGKFRIAYQNNLKYDWLFLDSLTGIYYGIVSGSVVRINYGYSNIGEQLDIRLTSKSFNMSSRLVWKRMVFYHMTSGQWLHINAYVDRLQIAHKVFKSDIRSECRFDFGPVSGEQFQFTIWGQYTKLAEIYLPMRIYVDGTPAS